MYVVRAALDTQLNAQDPALLLRGFKDTMVRYTDALGSRSVEVKGNNLWYKTLQMTDNVCTCKYVYEGNVNKTSQRSRFALRCRISSKARMERVLQRQSITFTRSSATTTTTQRTRQYLGIQINLFCYRTIQTSSRCHSDVAACSVTCLARRRSTLIFTRVSSSDETGMSGGGRLLIAGYAVACRSSRVMFC